MTHQILSGAFNPHGKVMMICIRTGNRMVLEKGLREWVATPRGLTYCTAKRHDGPIFDAKGICTSGEALICVNYVEGEA